MAENRLVMLAFIVFILILGFLLGFVLGSQLMSGKISLPPDAQKLSDCVPNMGEHWANPADMPFGPIYLIDKGRVVGIEYMVHEDELEENIMEIGEERIGKPAVMPTLGMTYNHVELNYLPGGHEGDTEPHYDVHMYLVSPEEQQGLCK